MRKIITLLFILTLCKVGFAQNYYVSGVVKNMFSEPIDKVGIFVKNSNFFTYTNDTGYFKILVPKGTFTLAIEKKGYKTYSTSLTLNDKDVVRNFNLEYEKVNEVGSLKIKSKRIDLSKMVIRGTVEAKSRFRDANNYKMTAFVKASVLRQGPKYDSLLKKTVKDTQQSALAQVYLSIDVGKDGDIKEERLGIKKQGDQSLLYWLSATEGWVDVYDNLIELDGVCEVPVISPVSKAGLISYRFRSEEVWMDGKKKMYKISYRPVKLGNALGKGYLIVEDTAFLVHKMVMHLPKMHLPEYNRFAMVQYYTYPTDSLALLNKQEFKYNARFGDQINYGSTTVTFDSFRFNQDFAKKHFGPMLSNTTKQAYEQDSNFWKSVRTSDLTMSELLFERKQDSFKSG